VVIDLMNARHHAYLSLTAVPVVGRLLVSGRPAFAISADGSRLLWANAAGAAFFELRGLDQLGAHRFSPLNPLTAQVARLARLLPSQSERMEVLRIGRGTSLTMLPAACRRLNLPQNERAVLVVAADAGAPSSLRSRAERLVNMMAGPDRLIAVLDHQTRVLGASGDPNEFEPAEAAIDDLIDAATRAGRPMIEDVIPLGEKERPAAVVSFTADGSDAFLVVVEPPRAPRFSAASGIVPTSAKTLPGNQTPVAAQPAPGVPAAQPDIQSPATPQSSIRAERFVWETGSDGRFTFVSPNLAAMVGPGNGDLTGRSWFEVGDVLGFRDDLPDDITAGWMKTIYWPLTDSPEAMAVSISAWTKPSMDGGTSGARGFGVGRPDDLRPDSREIRLTLSQTDIPSEHNETDSGQAEAVKPDEAPIVVSDSGGEIIAPGAAGDLDDAARKSIEAGTVVRFPTRDSIRGGLIQAPPATDTAAGPPDGAAGRKASSPPLTEPERANFRRIGESLNSSADEPEEPQVPASAPAAGEADTADDGGQGAINIALLDRLPIGLIVFRGSETVFANRTLWEMLGYNNAEELATAGGVSAVFPDENNGWAGRNLTGGGGRLIAARRDAGAVAVDVRLHSIMWAGASALMLSINAETGDVGLDKDELTEELATLAARVSELEAVLDTATDGVIVIDRRGIIDSLNHSAEALFGVDSTQMIGRPLADLLAEESRRPALEYLDGLAANGVASVLNDGREIIGKVPSGGLIPLFMTMGRVGDGDSYYAVLRDITHWKNVEDELIAARREAEEANAQKSGFLAKISHEIRTPLNAIIGFSEVMMAERFGPIKNDRYRSYLKDIHTSGSHLTSLINDLLDLSKIEAGKMDLSFESVEVNDVIQECVALMQPQANRERIIIRTSLAADVPNIVADTRSLRQILLNLMSNGIKFTAEGGQVIVSTSLEENGEVVLRVRDTGIGMSAKDVEVAMQPFQQLATTKRDSDRGTGLGLPLTKAMVEANRARFTIDSTLNQGTLVRISFPTTRVLAG
jgi:PAS domain S-box-containing protein